MANEPRTWVRHLGSDTLIMLGITGHEYHFEPNGALQVEPADIDVLLDYGGDELFEEVNP